MARVKRPWDVLYQEMYYNNYADTPTVGVVIPAVGVATPPEGSYTDIPLTGMRKVRIG